MRLNIIRCTTDHIDNRTYLQQHIYSTIICMEAAVHNPQPNPVAPPGDLGWQLGMILRGYQRRLDDAIQGMPEGFRGFQVLSTVVHRDPPNQQALSAHLAIDRTVLTYLLDELVDAGVVERVPAPADRRSRKIVATTEGEKLLASYEQQVEAAESEILTGLDHDDAKQFRALVSQLAMHIHRSDPTSDPCTAIDHLP